MKIKSLLKKSQIGVCMVLVSLVLNSCDMLHDDADDCGLYLRFKYDYNMKKTDLFSKQVKRVDVFFFDPNGILQEQMSQEGSVLANPDYRMDLTRLPRNDYQVITWAGLSENYKLDFEKGVTNINDFKLQLLYEDKLKDGVYSHDRSDLWYASDTIKKSDWRGHTKEVSLIKNTNYFHISLGDHNTRMNGEQLSEYTFQLTTGDGGYNHKNEPLSQKELIYGTFDYSEDIVEDKTKWMANIGTMRILKDQPAKLVVRTKDNKVVANIDLMYYIKEGSYKSEGEGMTYPEYLDRQDHFYIHFEINNYIAVSITINGWTTWLHSTDL